MNVAMKEQNRQPYRPQQNMQSNNKQYDPILKCLKVSPNLFTPEKLNLFDTVTLYTTLINYSQHIEQGERLSNLSWRIINKALLKDKSINRSKKRDGVKNLYYVLNPVNSSNKNNIASSNSSNNSTNGNNLSNNSNSNINTITKQNVVPDTNNNKEQSRVKMTNLNNAYISSTGLFPLLGQRFLHHENFRIDNNHSNNNNNTYLHIGDNHKTGNDINSNGKHPIVVTGFDTNTLITKTKTIKCNSNNNNNNNDTLSYDNSKYSKYNQNNNNNSNNNNNNNNNNIERQKTSLFTYASSKYNTDDNNNHSNRIFFSSEDEDEDDSDWNSLSSDEDDYNYDDYSDDNDRGNNITTNEKNNNFIHEDDEEDEDQYYKRQWSKLVFTKQSKLRATISPIDSISSSLGKSNEGLTPSNSNDQIIRKSLLTGLFSNEKNHHSNNSTPSPNPKSLSEQNSSTPSLHHHHHHHVLPTTSNITCLNKDTTTATTTTVTARGSVTAAQGPMNAIVPLEEVIHGERRGRQMNRPLTTRDSSRSPYSNSFNSLFYEEEEEEEEGREEKEDDGVNAKEKSRWRSNIHKDQNHNKQSNAPLTAQTILPTALSTHMFLPNSIIQQRRASRNENAIEEIRRNTSTDQSREQIEQASTTRRGSIDIPIKNRGQLFLKTRMEISEEEKYIRRKHLGNGN